MGVGLMMKRTLKDFLFGRPSEEAGIERDWLEAKSDVRARLDERLKPLELEKERLAGIGKSDPLPFDERLRRLNLVEEQINSAMDAAAAEEDEAWLKRMQRLREDGMASVNLARRILLWLYWHA